MLSKRKKSPKKINIPQKKKDPLHNEKNQRKIERDPIKKKE